METAIHIYAEYLQNIRTLSIQASLPTASNQGTRAELSAEGNAFRLTHEGQTVQIKLPVRISGNSNLTHSNTPTKSLSFRLQPTNATNASTSHGNGSLDAGPIIPWTANSLNQDAEIHCRSCLSTLVSRGQINSWKDLPSEGWAEMMEFWHCHKPILPPEQQAGAGEVSKKGYAANSRLALAQGTCLVDTLEFLVAADDCQTIKTSQEPNNSEEQENKPVICAQCNCIVGNVDSTAEDFYRLRKPQLALSPTATSKPISYSVEKWLACRLLNAVENQGVRKFSVRCQEDENKTANSARGLKVWLFAPSLIVSSSAAETPEPLRVAKVMWKDADLSMGPEKMNAQTLSEGDIAVSRQELSELRECLTRSARLLSESGKSFQEWQVGLLQPFVDSGAGIIG